MEQCYVGVQRPNRIKWIDTIRGFAIWMIVLAHIVQYFPNLGRFNSYLCSFHVSIFFVLSGCLARVQDGRKDSIGVLVKKRAKALLVPYFFFSIINFFLKFGVLYLKGEYTNEVFKQELVELFITGNGTVWFLTCLFLVEMLYYSIKKLHVPKCIYAVIVVIAVLVPFLLNDFSSPLMMVAKRVLLALAFYYMGYFLMYILPLKKLARPFGLYIGITCLIFGWLIWHFYGSGINYYGASFTEPVHSTLVNLLHSIGYIGVLSYYAEKDLQVAKILDYFGRNSLIVMVIHPILLMCYVYPIGFPIEKLSGWGQIMFAMMFFGLMLLLHIPIISIINHYFPWMIGKKKIYD